MFAATSLRPYICKDFPSGPARRQNWSSEAKEFPKALVGYISRQDIRISSPSKLQRRYRSVLPHVATCCHWHSAHLRVSHKGPPLWGNCSSTSRWPRASVQHEHKTKIHRTVAGITRNCTARNRLAKKGGECSEAFLSLQGFRSSAGNGTLLCIYWHSREDKH